MKIKGVKKRKSFEVWSTVYSPQSTVYSLQSTALSSMRGESSYPAARGRETGPCDHSYTTMKTEGCLCKEHVTDRYLLKGYDCYYYCYYWECCCYIYYS